MSAVDATRIRLYKSAPDTRARPMRYDREFKRFLADVWRSRWLLFELTRNDFRARYLGSTLGIVWVLVQPTITLLIMWFIFAVVYPAATPVSRAPFVLWLMAGMIPWYFISEALSGGTNSVVEKSFLVSKVVFRTSVLPMVKVASALIIHLFFLVIMLTVYFCYGFRPNVYYLQLPYFMLAGILFVLGVSWATSALTVFFRDTAYFMSVTLQFLFWLTPIFWSPEYVADRSPPLARILKLNPLQYVVEGYRGSLIYERWFWEPWKSMLYFWVVTALVFAGGAVIFRRLRPHFADMV